MNDRFKFRFYDEKNNFMITDEDSDENWNKCIELYDKDEWYFCVEKNLTFVLDYFDDKDFVVMQCTGLKDKNGKLIYEGDIIKCSYGFEYYIGVVVWDKQCIQFSMSVDKELYSFSQRSEYDKIEIIGNIYQNKELLNE